AQEELPGIFARAGLIVEANRQIEKEVRRDDGPIQGGQPQASSKELRVARILPARRVLRDDAPEYSGACALCHMQGSSAVLTNNLPHINAKNDYVFRAENYFNGGSGAVPDAVMLNYGYVPRTIHVKAGVPVTIYNTDQVVHNVVVDDGSFASNLIGTGGSVTLKFDQPGEVPFHCSVHSRMRAKIVVDPPDAAPSAAENYS